MMPLVTTTLALLLLLALSAPAQEADELIRAVGSGDEDAVATLVAAGAELEVEASNGGRPLHFAALQGNVAIAKLLIDSGAAVGATYLDGMTPLMLAAGRGSTELARVLIAAGARIDTSIASGMTPLIYAAQNGHLDTVAVLLEAGASTEHRAPDVGSAIEAARRSGQETIVQLIASPPTARPSVLERAKRSSTDVQDDREGGETPVTVGGKIQPPRKTHSGVPVYPTEMKNRGIVGIVILESVIDSQGRVTQLRVLRPAHPLLDRSAIDAARESRFEPTMLNGVAVPIIYNITIRYFLQ